MNYNKIEKKILNNKAMKQVIKARDVLNNLFNPKKERIKMDIKKHTVKKKWSPTEKWFINHSYSKWQ